MADGEAEPPDGVVQRSGEVREAQAILLACDSCGHEWESDPVDQDGFEELREKLAAGELLCPQCLEPTVVEL